MSAPGGRVSAPGGDVADGPHVRSGWPRGRQPQSLSGSAHSAWVWPRSAASALAISMLSAVPSAKHTGFLASDSSMAASDFRRLRDERRDTQGGAHSGCG